MHRKSVLYIFVVFFIGAGLGVLLSHLSNRTRETTPSHPVDYQIELLERSSPQTPHWVYRHVFVNGSTLYAVGTCDHASSKQEAIQRARQWAWANLAERLEWEIWGEAFTSKVQPIVEKARSHQITQSTTPHNDIVASIAQAMEHTFPTLISQRLTYWEQYKRKDISPSHEFYRAYCALGADKQSLIKLFRPYETQTTLNSTGMVVIPTFPTYAWHTNRTEGMVVIEIVPESPATAAGLQPGDQILAINGLDIATRSDFFAALTKWKAILESKSKMELSVSRGRSFLTLSLDTASTASNLR